MSIEQLSPAQLAKLKLQEAERAATEAEWKRYRELEDRHRRARFNIQEPKPVPHGTTNGYTHYLCRCKECRRAWADYMRARYRKSHPKKERTPPKHVRVVKSHQHGTLTGYSYGCRCERCRDSNRKWVKQSRTKQHGTEYVYSRGCRCKKCTHAATEARKRRRKILPKELIRHGTETAYNHHNCRCSQCTEAHRVISRKRNAHRREYYRDNPEMIPQSKHGTTNGYTTYYCRCEKCRNAWREYTNAKRAKDRENARDTKSDSRN